MPDPTPAEADAEKPKSLVEKFGAALPIGLTALAAVFGSMANEALQHAMYWKSQAAQDQSKATNQWSLAGFKRDRALIMQATAAQLRAVSGYAAVGFAPGSDANADTTRAAEWLRGSGPPKAELPKVEDQAILELQEMIRTRQPEQEVLKKAGTIKMEAINKAIDDAEKANEHFDKEWEPTVKAAGTLVADQGKVGADDPDRAKKLAGATAAQAAGFELEQRRYRLESTLNQGIGFLYEARVKVSSAESDKHRRKSELLGYAILVAQIGAVASSLALARKRQSLLWLLASLIGLVAIGFGGYAILPTLPFAL